ncbi:hypothetical protein [Absidia glauca]|uniref:C2H2-type domain-containing protein n=1 Tax=Absidia glauca TaxID=4829 RepID=A0A168LDX0_ABSGL|nr:hypothetical protein [Absidia glauca]
MPAPVEYNSVRRMSTISAPIHDINFDTYDFLLCKPQTDVKDTFESRELEASYCKDFACCGLILNDLHDLLQHYEECHVHLEEEEDEEEQVGDDDILFDSGRLEGSTDSDIGVTTTQTAHLTQQEDDDFAVFGSSLDLDLNHLKKRAAAYLSDLCQQQQQQHDLGDDEENDFGSKKKVMLGKQQPPSFGKKRSFEQSTLTVDLATQSAVKKLALATNMIQPLTMKNTAEGSNAMVAAMAAGCTTPGATTCFTDEDFLAHAGVLLASSAHYSTVHADKPYKCPVQGCDKAYKNPNGLKYHNEHGHCNLVTDESENVASKPYQCTIGDCNRRYKNLNGLKYHIEHSHVAALNQTLATFGTSFFQQQQQQSYLPYQVPSSSQASSSMSTPNLSPSSSPELSCLSPMF